MVSAALNWLNFSRLQLRISTNVAALMRINTSEVMNIIGKVEGKTCILIDDMIDTAGTIGHAEGDAGRVRCCGSSCELVLTQSYSASYGKYPEICY